MHRMASRVRWVDCCAKRIVGDLGIIDPHEAMTSLLSKWMIKAFLPGSTGLQILLKYKIKHAQPSKQGGWPEKNLWSIVKNHKRSPGSRSWGLINRAWQKMLDSLREMPPTSVAEARSVQLWWGTTFKGNNVGLDQEEALSLYKKGMKTVGDLYDSQNRQFKTLEIVGAGQLIEKLKASLSETLRRPEHSIDPGDWNGFFQSKHNQRPVVSNSNGQRIDAQVDE